jgi:hypothetical protein
VARLGENDVKDAQAAEVPRLRPLCNLGAEAMTEHTPKQIALAREIASRLYPPQMVGLSCRENVLHSAAYNVALATIREVSERAAHFTEDHSRHADPADIATALRNGDHLK